MPPEAADRWAIALLLLAVAISAGAWRVIATHGWARRLIGAASPRQPVPWTGMHLLGAVGIYLACGLIADYIGRGAPANALPVDPPSVASNVSPEAQPGERAASADAPPNDDAQPSHVDHPLKYLLHADRSVATLCAAWILAVLVAPLVEEFLYRVVLQGWLQNVEEGFARAKAAAPIGRPRTPRMGARAIFLSSLIFALVHLRSRPDGAAALSLRSIVAQCVANLIAVAGIIAWFRWSCGASLRDFGIAGPDQTEETEPPRNGVAEQVGVGLVALLAMAAPVYMIFAMVRYAVPADVGVSLDPLPLFFLAIALGFLYQRTHRLLPSFVLHMGFNAVGMAIVTIDVLGSR